MPVGVSLSMILAVLIPVCVVTVLLRQIPFSFVKALRGSDLVSVLDRTMPVGVMVVLVVYTIAGQSAAPGGILAALLGAAVTAGLHLWRRESGLSILGGTAVYMVLVNFVF